MDRNTFVELANYPTPLIANALDKAGLAQPAADCVGPDIRTVEPRPAGATSCVGVAVTARMDTSPGEHGPINRFAEWARAIAEIAENVPVFAVIEAVGPDPRRVVTMGDTWATVIRKTDVAGFLTNGSVRDRAGIRRAGLPCWAAGATAMHGSPGRVRWLDVGGAVTIDGMLVNSGDIIHADENGAIVMRPQSVDAIGPHARAIAEKERETFARLGAEDMTLELFLGG